jgi:serine protease Do
MKRTLGSGAPEKGALVSDVRPGSPAMNAGVKPGDVITSVDATPVDGSRAVQRTVLSKQIGQKLQLGVWRDGKSLKLGATTGEMPGENVAQKGGPGSPKAKLGLALQTLTPDLAERFNLGSGMKGALVAQVKPGSPAEEAGIQEGDIIVEVDRKNVASADEATKLLSQERAGGHMLRLRRGDAALFLVVPQS